MDISIKIGDTLCITYFNTKLYLNYGFYQFYTYDTLSIILLEFSIKSKKMPYNAKI